MLQRNEIRGTMEALEIGKVTPEARDELDLEKVLRRAREIHRQHGGIFGYDFEDWVQAWSDLPSRNGETSRNGQTRLELAEEIEPAVLMSDVEEVCEPWLRYDN
jgi:hypothetical protein